MELPLLLIAIAVILVVLMVLPSKEEPDFKPQPKDGIAGEEHGEVNYLKNQLKNLREDRQNLQNELDSTKNLQVQLDYDLKKYKDWNAKVVVDLEKYKTENLQLRQDVIARENDLGKELSINMNLNKELKEKTERISALESEIRGAKDKSGAFEDHLKKPEGTP